MKKYAYGITERGQDDWVDQGTVKAKNKSVAYRKLKRQYGKRKVVHIGFEVK